MCTPLQLQSRGQQRPKLGLRVELLSSSQNTFSRVKQGCGRWGGKQGCAACGCVVAASRNLCQLSPTRSVAECRHRVRTLRLLLCPTQANKPVLGGRQVTTTAPWPFIDPQRPTVLPEYVGTSNTRVPKPPVAFVEALLKVKVGLGWGEQSLAGRVVGAGRVTRWEAVLTRGHNA